MSRLPMQIQRKLVLHCVSKNYTLFVFAITFLIVNQFSQFLAKNVAKRIGNVEDRILVENLHKFKGYRVKK